MLLVLFILLRPVCKGSADGRSVLVFWQLSSEEMISPVAYFNYFPSLNFTKFLVFYLGPHWIRVGDWKYLEKKPTIFSFKFPLPSLSGAQPYKNAFLSVCLKSEVELLDGVLATIVQSLTAGWTPHWLSDNGSASVHSAVSLTSPSPPQCHAVCL